VFFRGGVSAEADDRVVALGKRGAVNGTLYAGNTRSQPAETQAGPANGEIEATTFTSGETKRVTAQNAIFLGLPLFVGYHYFTTNLVKRMKSKLRSILVFALVVVPIFCVTRVVVDVKYLDWKTRTDADLNITAGIIERYKEYYGHYPSSFDELYADSDFKPFQRELSPGNRYEYRQLSDGFIIRGINGVGIFKNKMIEDRYTSLESHARFGTDAPRK
jgi:hypothetical protein